MASNETYIDWYAEDDTEIDDHMMMNDDNDDEADQKPRQRIVMALTAKHARVGLAAARLARPCARPARRTRRRRGGQRAPAAPL